MPTFFESLSELMAGGAPLVTVTVVDTMGSVPKLEPLLTTAMPSVVASPPGDAFVVLMTMGHTTDKPILLEILRTRTFPYLGVIGSDSKAIILKRDIAEAGLPKEMESAFFCP